MYTERLIKRQQFMSSGHPVNRLCRAALTGGAAVKAVTECDWVVME
jgi:hypothetical protein